jgi:hypothetical protein
MNDNDRRQRTEGYTFLVLFCLTIPAANWLIGHAGTVCVSNGPCLVPVAPGIMAPSGVLMIGLALVLRDLVQRRLGVEFGIGAIIVGAAISAGLAPPSLVVASAAAFLLSEFADFATGVSHRSDHRQTLDGSARNPLRRIFTPSRRARRPYGRVRPGYDLINRNPAKRDHRHHHDDVAKEGHSSFVDDGGNAIWLFRQACRWSGVHIALRSCA